MGLFIYWNQSGSITLLCFDVPTKVHVEIEAMLGSQTVDYSCPYATLTIVIDAVTRLYDDSVWSNRNHISQWEAVSSPLHIACERPQ